MVKKCVLQWKKLHPKAVAPKKGSTEAAGFDLSSVKNYTIFPFSHKIVDTGIQINLPPSTYGRIASRSSWSISGVHIGGGCIDRDYTGEVKVIMYNITQYPVKIRKGDRVAQLICEKIEYPELEEVDEIHRVTERGSGCFGSTNFDP